MITDALRVAQGGGVRKYCTVLYCTAAEGAQACAFRMVITVERDTETVG